MNSGAVPDIKAAWKYASEATCQAAMYHAMDKYNNMLAVMRNKIEENSILDEEEFELCFTVSANLFHRHIAIIIHTLNIEINVCD
jgi:hypothetical protein